MARADQGPGTTPHPSGPPSRSRATDVRHAGADGETWRPGIVLDLETAPDDLIASRVRDGGGPKSIIERVALHRLDALSMLHFELGPGLAVRGLRLASMSTRSATEGDMLLAAADAARDLGASGGLLASFNGVGHDVPFLRHRLIATARPERVNDLDAAEHVDVMIAWAGGGRYPRLADLCAALGLPVWQNDRGGIGEREAKSRLDVCATFVLLMMLRAAAAGLPHGAVDEAWRAMSHAVLAGGVSDPNLLGLLRHPSIVRTR